MGFVPDSLGESRAHCAYNLLWGMQIHISTAHFYYTPPLTDLVLKASRTQYEIRYYARKVMNHRHCLPLSFISVSSNQVQGLPKRFPILFTSKGSFGIIHIGNPLHAQCQHASHSREMARYVSQLSISKSMLASAQNSIRCSVVALHRSLELIVACSQSGEKTIVFFLHLFFMAICRHI